MTRARARTRGRGCMIVAATMRQKFNERRFCASHILHFYGARALALARVRSHNHGTTNGADPRVG